MRALSLVLALALPGLAAATGPQPSPTLPKHQVPKSKDGNLVVGMCDGKTSLEVAGVKEGTLIICVSAPAHDGRANRATCRLLAKRLGVAPSRLRILRGQRSRDKLIEVVGIGQPTVDAALGLNDDSEPL